MCSSSLSNFRIPQDNQQHDWLNDFSCHSSLFRTTTRTMGPKVRSATQICRRQWQTLEVVSGWETEKEEGYLRGEEGEFLTLDCCPKIAAKNDRIRIMNWNAGSSEAAAQPASRFFLTINLEGRSKLNEKVISLGRFFTFWEGPRSGIKSGGSLFHKVTFSGRNLIYFKNSVLFSRIQQLSWRKCQILFTSAKSQLRLSSIPTWIQFNRSIVNIPWTPHLPPSILRQVSSYRY